MAWTSLSPRSSSWAICRFDRLRPIKYRHRIHTRSGWWCPASTVPLRSSKRALQDGHRQRAGRPVIVSAVPDYVGGATRRTPHTVRPALLADQLEAFGIIEQTGQTDQVSCHETVAAMARILSNQPINFAFLTRLSAPGTPCPEPLTHHPETRDEPLVFAGATAVHSPRWIGSTQRTSSTCSAAWMSRLTTTAS
jgi:hypothetical protein